MVELVDKTPPRDARWRNLKTLPDRAASASRSALVVFLDLGLGEVLRRDAVEEALELVDDLLLVHVLALELDRRLVDHRVCRVDRRLRPNGDRDRVGGARVDLELGAVVLDRDRREERVLAQLGHRDADDLDLELAEDVHEQVVRQRPRRGRALELHQDRRGLRMADPDRQEPFPSAVFSSTIGCFPTRSNDTP